eukprot:8812533-Pyramimonas_sp.AAC.1
MQSMLCPEVVRKRRAVVIAHRPPFAIIRTAVFKYTQRGAAGCVASAPRSAAPAPHVGSLWVILGHFGSLWVTFSTSARPSPEERSFPSPNDVLRLLTVGHFGSLWVTFSTSARPSPEE